MLMVIIIDISVLLADHWRQGTLISPQHYCPLILAFSSYDNKQYGKILNVNIVNNEFKSIENLHNTIDR